MQLTSSVLCSLHDSTLNHATLKRLQWMTAHMRCNACCLSFADAELRGSEVLPVQLSRHDLIACVPSQQFCAVIADIASVCTVVADAGSNLLATRSTAAQPQHPWAAPLTPPPASSTPPVASWRSLATHRVQRRRLSGITFP